MVVLPQLSSLDGVKIEISQRILAKQRWEQIAESILRDEEEYLIKREKEKQEVNILISFTMVYIHNFLLDL